MHDGINYMQHWRYAAGQKNKGDNLLILDFLHCKHSTTKIMSCHMKCQLSLQGGGGELFSKQNWVCEDNYKFVSLHIWCKGENALKILCKCIALKLLLSFGQNCVKLARHTVYLDKCTWLVLYLLTHRMHKCNHCNVVTYIHKCITNKGVSITRTHNLCVERLIQAFQI